MEHLFIEHFTISESETKVKEYLEQVYQIIGSTLKESLAYYKRHCDALRDDLYVYLEYPYVDKAYRDTYYTYFASKLDAFPRNSIRLSFFNRRIEEDEFRKIAELHSIQEAYLGFLAIRPTFPKIIGRNVIHPSAFKNADHIGCKVEYNATANCIKFKATGFPHSSQDGETISCAETTVWSILEYFGHKYSEYKPSLPSQVNAILSRFSFERLVPSKGLTASQISYALREYGFGVKIYSKSAYPDNYYRILRAYIESGIPVVGVLQNTTGTGHAVNIIGREKLTQEALNSLAMCESFGNRVNVFDFGDLDLKCAFIDDNYPPYQMTSLSTPVSYYSDPKFAGCELTNFIVPLYPKIYLEAGEARTISITVIKKLKLLVNKDILIKCFLMSSRTFKNELSLNTSIDLVVKELLLAKAMPKFIWVTEISDRTMILNDLVQGMIVLDATEPKRLGILAAVLENTFLSKDLTSLQKISVNLTPFQGFVNNLK